MLPISIGVSSQSVSAPAFAASLSNDCPEPEVALFGQGVPSQQGALDFSVTPSGGSGSYTFSWQLQIVDSGGGMVSIASQGTTNQAAFSQSTVVGGFNQGLFASVRAKCIVSDGVASNITLESDPVGVIGLY